MNSSIHIRPACAGTDLPGITHLLNNYESQPVTVEQVGSWFRDYAAPEYHCQRLVAVDENEQIVGYSRVLRYLSLPEHHFRIGVSVEPACCHQGIGSAIWEVVLDYLRQQGATRLTTEVDDDDPGSLRFAQQRGFTIDHHMFHSTLNLATFDETPYLPGIAALEAKGFRFCSFADFPDTHETRVKLWDLNETTGLDMPNSNGSRTIFEEFEKWVFATDWFRGDGQLLAVDGDTWAGMCAVSLNHEKHTAYNEHTGVLREYRGRKIALALKVLAARYARQNGALTIGTDNDSLNVPMLAINRKMGYQPEPGQYLLASCL